jgi:8-oxo-dGTP pyrophosphatase MutT (NUDIX family)
VEGPETLEETALRETQEESGLDVSRVSIVGEVDTTTYRFQHKGKAIEKTVTMFLATLPWAGRAIRVKTML